jgi:cytochrome P450
MFSLWDFHRSGFGQAILFKNYGEEVKKSRRLIHAGLGPRELQAYYPMFTNEATLFAKRLLDDPQGFRQHIRRQVTSFTKIFSN